MTIDFLIFLSPEKLEENWTLNFGAGDGISAPIYQ
jgi:hypothetical protein